MSREHDVILAKYNQLIDKLEVTDPVQHPQEFGAVLDMLDRMHFFMGRLSVEKFNEVRKIGEAIPVTDVKLPGCNVGEKIAEPPVEENEAEKPSELAELIEKTVAHAKEEPAKTYTKEEVRAALGRARKNGMVVSEILSEFDVDSFPALPESKYPELMARIGES